jgi:hypothetical protein
MDDTLEAVRKLKAILWNYASALYILAKLTRVPPSYGMPLDEHMELNRKAIVASIALLFLARGIHGWRVGDIGDTVLVTAIYAVLVVAFTRIGSALTQGTKVESKKIAADWSSFAIVLWAASLVLVILFDAAAYLDLIHPIDLWAGPGWIGPLLASFVVSLLSLAIIQLKAISLQQQSMASSSLQTIFMCLFIVACNSAIAFLLVYWRWTT